MSDELVNPDVYEGDMPLWAVLCGSGFVVESVEGQRILPLFTESHLAEKFINGHAGWFPVEVPTIELAHAVIRSLLFHAGLTHVAIDFPPRGTPVNRYASYYASAVAFLNQLR